MPEFPHPTSHHYVSQRMRLHYVNWGNPEAPPVLLVHGVQDHCRTWDAVALQLVPDHDGRAVVQVPGVVDDTGHRAGKGRQHGCARRQEVVHAHVDGSPLRDGIGFPT